MDVPGIALVTGAASGIGKACVAAFARDGAGGIAMLDLKEEGLAAAKTQIEEIISKTRTDERPCVLRTYAVDVTDEQQITNVVNDIATQFGRLDYVVNAAGIAMKHPGGTAYVKTDDWRRVLEINLNGSFFVLRAAAKIMLEQKPILSSIDGRPLQRGSIVNFGSVQAVVGIELSTAYTTSKHAIVGLTRTASEDYAKDGLRINAICPGYTETPLTTSNPAIREAMEKRVGTVVPMQRMGRASEIADGVIYLAGGRSSFVTGSVLMVDGGYTSR